MSLEFLNKRLLYCIVLTPLLSRSSFPGSQLPPSIIPLSVLHARWRSSRIILHSTADASSFAPVGLWSFVFCLHSPSLFVSSLPILIADVSNVVHGRRVLYQFNLDNYKP